MRAIAAVIVLLVLGCAGCGLRAGGKAGGHTATPSTSVTVPASPGGRQIRCVHLTTPPGQRTVSLTAADNHASFCVLRGTGIFVALREVTPALWLPIQSSSAAVEPRPSGVMTLARGETGGFFRAAAVGTANLTSADPRCPPGPHPARHLSSRCPAPLRFAVTIHVLS